MIGEKIKQLRIEKCLSQKELADALSISASAIGMYEQKRRLPDLDTVIKLSHFFDVSTDYLLLEINKRGLSDEEQRWLNLYWDIPIYERSECIGFIKGYISHSHKSTLSQTTGNNCKDTKRKEKKQA